MAAMEAEGMEVHILANGAVSLYSQEEVDRATWDFKSIGAGLVSKMSAGVTKVKAAAGKIADLTSAAIAGLGSGPLADELKKELSSLGPEETAEALGAMEASESKEEQTNVFSGLVNYIKVRAMPGSPAAAVGAASAAPPATVGTPAWALPADIAKVQAAYHDARQWAELHELLGGRTLQCAVMGEHFSTSGQPARLRGHRSSSPPVCSTSRAARAYRRLPPARVPS